MKRGHDVDAVLRVVDLLKRYVEFNGLYQKESEFIFLNSNIFGEE